MYSWDCSGDKRTSQRQPQMTVMKGFIGLVRANVSLAENEMRGTVGLGGATRDERQGAGMCVCVCRM